MSVSNTLEIPWPPALAYCKQQGWDKLPRGTLLALSDFSIPKHPGKRGRMCVAHMLFDILGLKVLKGNKIYTSENWQETLVAFFDITLNLNSCEWSKYL
jgi:hypothetical protein